MLIGELIALLYPEGDEWRSEHAAGKLRVTCIEAFSSGVSVRYLFTVREDFVPDDWSRWQHRARLDLESAQRHGGTLSDERIDNTARTLFAHNNIRGIALADDLGTHYGRGEGSAASGGPTVLLGTAAFQPGVPAQAVRLSFHVGRTTISVQLDKSKRVFLPQP